MTQLIDCLKSTVEATALYPRAVVSIGKRAVARVIVGSIDKLDTKYADKINGDEDV